MRQTVPVQTPAPVIVIGAGPVGLYAAFQLGLRGMRPVLIDALPREAKRRRRRRKRRPKGQADATPSGVTPGSWKDVAPAPSVATASSAPSAPPRSTR